MNQTITVHQYLSFQGMFTIAKMADRIGKLLILIHKLRMYKYILTKLKHNVFFLNR